jgi:hypothetical protein
MPAKFESFMPSNTDKVNHAKRGCNAIMQNYNINAIIRIKEIRKAHVAGKIKTKPKQTPNPMP